MLHVVQYKQMYDESIKDPEKFWAKVANDFHWQEKVCLLPPCICALPLDTLQQRVPESAHRAVRLRVLRCAR